MKKIFFIVCYRDGVRKKFCRFYAEKFDTVYKKAVEEYGDSLISIIWQSSSPRLSEKN